MLTAILLIIICIIVIIDECRRPPKYPPGPPWIPFLGNGPELRELSRKLGGQHLAFIELAKTYEANLVGLKLGKERVVCVCSYESVRQVMTSDDYAGRPDNFFFRLRSMGTRKGITGTDGDLWKEQRTFLISHLRVLGFGKTTMEDMVKQEIADTMALIPDQTQGVDLSALLSPTVLNVLWNLTSGKGLKGNRRIEKLLTLLQERSKAFDMAGGTLNNYPWLRYIAPEKTGYNLVQDINLRIKDFITEAIDEHKRNWTENRCDDFIYSFLSQMKKFEGQSSYFSEKQLIMVCLDIFIAGSTTTSNTINFAFLAMILYPEVQANIHQCLNSTFKQNENIHYCDKQRVPYVEAVLLECQRLFPVVPISGPRRALHRTHLGEYIIPKNTTVLINLHAIHHDKDYWKDPETFRPERFLDKNGSLVCQERVMTFGLGKRRCLGDALAKTCIFMFFVEILRKYRLEHDGSPENKPTGKQVPGITMTPEKYRVKFVPKF